MFWQERSLKKSACMQPFTIKYHSLHKSPPVSSFFILSRGHNTGRPSYSPNANCFVFSCAPQDLQHFYWLVYALWYSRKFETYLYGSVIEFMRVDDLRNLVAESTRDMRKVQDAVDALQSLLLLETKLKKQLDMIQRSRMLLLS